MKESQKTGIFAAVALVVVLLAVFTQPRRGSIEASASKELIGKPLFPEFSDPKVAASMSIARYDETLGSLAEFEVAKDPQSGLWTIPSHSGYPADATSQMRDAANLFVDLKVLGVASELRADHETFGVVQPDANKLKVGDKGVGLLVRIQDAKDKDLASLIIGKEIKDSPGRRFVRVPTQDVVLDVQINTAPLTTDFRNWIEKDLLKLSSFDVAEIGIRDYSIVRSKESGVLSRLYDADIAFDATSSKWNLLRWVAYDGRTEKPMTIEPGKEVDASRLNDLKTALDQLEIVDVDRKPAGLSADLKADKSLLESGNENVLSLYERGFFPQPTPDGGSEILSSSGELVITLNDGVQYLLRFGNLFGDQNADSSGLNRRLMVTARFDESRFPPPDLKVLPETIEDLKKMDAAKNAPAIDAAPSTPPATDTPVETPAAPAADAPVAPAADTAPTTDEPAKTPEETPAAPPQSSVTRPGSVKFVSTQQPPAEAPAGAPAAETPAPAAQEAAPPAQESEEELKERLQLVREEITKENQRLIDERNDKIAKSKKRVDELNARFADWYYVVSENVYKKLRIQQAELTRPIQAAGANGPNGALPGFPPGGIPGLIPGQ